MHISEIINPDQLTADINAGYITARTVDDLTIYNYTDKAQWDRHWTEATTQCRGIITDVSGTIVARPFPKFFNHNEPEAQTPNEPVIITDKMDGSLGIAYITNNTVRIATRGSLASEQALHATRILAEQYPDWTPPAGITALFEIIYPENRIVLDYGNIDDLILLGGINISTGDFVKPWDIEWTGARVEQLQHFSLREALAAPPRKNAEGMVVWFAHSNIRVKIKQHDYIRLHRIVTGWNERTIWEHLSAGETVEQLIDGLPDEFHRWATETAGELTRLKDFIELGARSEFKAITEALPGGFGRKEFALEAVKHPNFRPALFQLLDDRPITEWAWKQVRPTTLKEASLV